MGQSSKKKKHGGRGSKKNKNRVQIKDISSEKNSYNELMGEELTALNAIFQDDCKIISESPLEITIESRPYMMNISRDDLEQVTALLYVRCSFGYPYKSPRIRVTSEKLIQTEVDRLLALLYDQANSDSREGRVMIFNLVEVAQEFLTDIVPEGSTSESVQVSDNSPQKESVLSKENNVSRGSFVYVLIDIFSGSGESWWGTGVDDMTGIGSSINCNKHNGLKDVNATLDKSLKVSPKSFNLGKVDMLEPSVPKLDTVDEKSESETESSSDTSISSVEEVASGHDRTEDDIMDFWAEEDISREEDSELDREYKETRPHPLYRLDHEKDLLMVHLLRMACSSKVTLTKALPQISKELYELGIFSESMYDLALKPPDVFNKKFGHVSRRYLDSSKISEFWKSNTDIGENAPPPPSSRYLNDFEELKPLGHGGFGHVVLCKNKLDGRNYAMKKIRLRDKILPINDRILREVATLSRLQHQHVVRYYQAWFEAGVLDSCGDDISSSRASMNTGFSYRNASYTHMIGNDNNAESTYLYIQMEYCPRTLRRDLETNYHFDEEASWHLFHQIVEGLAHIHGQGIIHRDLTPNNIFFDARNDIKIGDFGLAKFLMFEQLDQDLGFQVNSTGVSVDGTGQMGTYFYTAPEIEQGWPKIDEKVDMYSLGIVFFEIWHPFGTAMERHVVLSDLKLKGEFPAVWVDEYPQQASLLKRLISSSPSDRPSAKELLQNSFPLQIEYELLDDMLTRMQTSEDTKISNKVLNVMFNEEILNVKYAQQHSAKLTQIGHHDSCYQHINSDTEMRDEVIDVSKEIFQLHCAKHLETIPMHLLDDLPSFKRNTVKLLSHGGGMIELCHELRSCFDHWVARNQKTCCRQYEIAYVYRKAVGHSPPNRYLQGDFDIVGGTPTLIEAEAIKVTMDILVQFFLKQLCDVHINHAGLLESIWSWVGFQPGHRKKVAELLSLMNCLRPQSSGWKSKWVLIRRQLLQELKLADVAVNRLQTVALRFCGPLYQVLPRLRGALPTDEATRNAFDMLLSLFGYLRIWGLDEQIFLDALMPPTEYYYRDFFFQAYAMKENNPGSLTDGVLLAIGGRYDYLLGQIWDHETKLVPPVVVGTSIALETVIHHSSVEFKRQRNECSISVLVCSRGGGGLLEERMELVLELWEQNIKAELVPLADPTPREQYEYASEHEIKCLVIIKYTALSQSDFVKVRHLELKKEKEVERTSLVRFLFDAMATQFRNPSIWT